MRNGACVSLREKSGNRLSGRVRRRPVWPWLYAGGDETGQAGMNHNIESEAMLRILSSL